MKQHNLSSVSAAVKGLAKPVVNVLKYDLIGNGMARVLCSISHAGDSREDSSFFTEALRERMHGKMQAVAGSFKSLDKGQYLEHVTGIVTVVKESMMATEQNLNTLKSISSNMFMDEEEHMWKVCKTEAGNLLVKTTGIEDDEALANLLSHSCASMSSMSNVNQFRQLSAQASSLKQQVSGGDFVSYVDDGQIQCGYVVATATSEKDTVAVVLSSDQKTVSIPLDAVTEIHPQSDFPAYEMSDDDKVNAAVATARGDVNIEMLLAYYKKVYARSPAFYQKFAARVRSHAFC
jgi:hypothetical protein